MVNDYWKDFAISPHKKKPVIDLLQNVSQMGEDLMDVLDQMDLNPVFVYKDRCCVVDAKLIVKKVKP